ncbi:hypothetical protein [Candidatus Xianfuyuplasma coldseepsis]|uniref:Uncharacterized protein n=1 Tax=Candidatus Xianfuyuplasma coldseepsis TaxID=2782163 RepID=A0A7L7KPV3_9MOLU|nr:hypothetical protein [Xianfuyuplasma coldseepsis]QMS84707.1 hypothetical protein G4Z02_02710 [Xianfuyuplasma coldseepsis]
MNPFIKEYINKLFSYIPVAVFIFVIVFSLNMQFAIEDIKAEHGTDALDIVIEYYRFFFFRTLLFSLLIPLFDPILKIAKLSYKVRGILHGLAINIAVGIIFYRPGNNVISMLIIVAMCTTIYITVWLVLQLREKQFITNANKIFERNE